MKVGMFGKDVAARLRREQQRVGEVLRALDETGWDNLLSPSDKDRLLCEGHFDEYAAELEWSPREVAGHLRDSARTFHERILRLQRETNPFLPDFVTTAPERIDDYRVTSLPQLVDSLFKAQRRLAQIVEAVDDEEFQRAGVHEVDGIVTLGELLDFLPAHQADHAKQLEALQFRGTPR